MIPRELWYRFATVELMLTRSCTVQHSSGRQDTHGRSVPRDKTILQYAWPLRVGVAAFIDRRPDGYFGWLVGTSPSLRVRVRLCQWASESTSPAISATLQAAPPHLPLPSLLGTLHRAAEPQPAHCLLVTVALAPQDPSNNPPTTTSTLSPLHSSNSSDWACLHA